jgi:hypothetical protein
MFIMAVLAIFKLYAVDEFMAAGTSGYDAVLDMAERTAFIVPAAFQGY